MKTITVMAVIMLMLLVEIVFQQATISGKEATIERLNRRWRNYRKRMTDLEKALNPPSTLQSYPPTPGAEFYLLPLIRSHTQALVAAAYAACAEHLPPLPDATLVSCSCGAYFSSRAAWQEHIRSLTPAGAARELERIKREACDGMLALIPSRDNKRLRTLCLMKNGTYYPLEIIPATLADEIEQRIAALEAQAKEKP